MPDTTPSLGQTYSLTVQNQNSKVTHFALFQKLPVLVGPSNDAISLAWIVGTAAPGTVEEPSQSLFEWTIDYSVMVGYVQNQGVAGHPRRFSTSSQKKVKITTNNMVQVTASPDESDAPGVPYFPSDAADGLGGEVQVQSDDTIPTNALQAATRRSLVIALAMDGKAAVATELLPNMLHQFTPHPSYFILAGSFVQGQVIDLALAAAPFQVTFDGITDKTITFTERNQFQNGPT